MRANSSAPRVLCGFVIAVTAFVTSPPCPASTLSIRHQAKPCVVPSKYPLIRAAIEPAAEIRSARVVFHASGSASWYAVDMERAPDGTWSTPLPRPTEAVTQIGYFLVATGEAVQDRLPERSELVVDVTSACDGESFDTARHGPSMLGLVAGADREGAGFDLQGVKSFTANVQVETPAVSPAATEAFPLPFLLPVGTRLRLSTIPPQLADGRPVRDDASSITLVPPGNGDAVTIAKGGRKIEGRLVGLDHDAYVLSVPGIGRVRVRQQDVRSLELREPGHPGMAILGGLGGLTAGLLTTVLVCATADLQCGSGAFLLGTLAGAGFGGAAAGGGSWRPVPLFGRSDPVSLTLTPHERGAAAGLTIRF